MTYDRILRVGKGVLVPKISFAINQFLLAFFKLLIRQLLFQFLILLLEFFSIFFEGLNHQLFYQAISSLLTRVEFPVTFA